MQRKGAWIQSGECSQGGRKGCEKAGILLAFPYVSLFLVILHLLSFLYSFFNSLLNQNTIQHRAFHKDLNMGIRWGLCVCGGSIGTTDRCQATSSRFLALAHLK